MLTKLIESGSNEQTPAQLMGIYLQSKRESAGYTLEDTAKRLGMESDELANFEQGVNPLPPPHIIAKWAHTLGYRAAETVDILGEAGYLPKTGSLTDLERPVLMGALQEIFYPTDGTQTHHRLFSYLRIGAACFLTDVLNKRHRK